jgi:hypothetical protein
MPTYCWSGATGANDGSSWADAYTDVVVAWTNTGPGEDLWIASDHYELRTGSSVTFVGSSTDPQRIISVDRADDSYKPATSVQIDMGTFLDFTVQNVTVMGLYVIVGDDLSGSDAFYEDCTIEWQSVGDTSLTTRPTFLRCTLKVWIGWESGSYGGRYIGCTFVNLSGFDGWYDTSGAFENEADFIGCDLSSHDPAWGICRSAAAGHTYNFDGCTFAAGQMVEVGFGHHRGRVYLIGCDEVPGNTYRAEARMLAGAMTSDTSIYRNGGWVDVEGDTPLSHLITPAATCSPRSPVDSVPTVAYLGTTGSQTITVEIAENFTVGLTDADAWIEIDYLGTTDSPLWTNATSRVPLGTTTIPTSAATWTGAAGYTARKLTKTVTVNKAGAYRVKVYLAKYEAGKSMAYCPKIEVS